MNALAAEGLTVFGTRPLRHDGWDKVTGRATYGPDFKLAGMLCGKVLRSPHAHACIRRIDVRAALAYPGVRAVVTGRDLPEPADRDEAFGDALGQPCIPFGNVLARDKVLYVGHPVAAVAAVTPEAAQSALDLIEVDYDVLVPVMSGLHAMRPGAPLLHDDLTTLVRTGRDGKRQDTGVHSNIANLFQFNQGDVQAGLRDSDIVIEHEFETANIHHGYIEPHAATGLWSQDGTTTIWCSSQGTFRIRDQVARVLRQPVSKVRVVPLEIGGGFGGKVPAYIEPLVAVLSRASGRAVRIVLGRQEIFEATGPASSTAISIKLGATRTGVLSAVQMRLIYDAGAYPGAPINAVLGALNPYRIKHVQVDSYDVVVNKPKVARHRAPGAPQAVFALESAIDELCQQLEIDPVEFRMRNAVPRGEMTLEGHAAESDGFMQALEAARSHPHYSAPLGGPSYGRGLAAAWWHGASGPASCLLSVQADGTVSLIEGAVDIGGSRTAVALHAAEALGIAVEDVQPTVVDTASIGYTNATVGSGTTYRVGWAAYEAAQDVLRQMKARLAALWHASVDDVAYARGMFTSVSSPEQQISFKDLAARLNASGGPITGQATLVLPAGGDVFGVQIVDVHVDSETGKVDVVRCTAVQDVGRAAHRSYVEGQIQGGMVQGIGWALNEEYVFDAHGRMLNPTFLDYKMPTSLDVPMVDTVVLEVPGPHHPYGLKGVGELPIVPTLAAVANAVARATGARPTCLPLSPARVQAVLQSYQTENGPGATRI